MADWVNMAPGIRRRVVGDGVTVMLVEIEFEAGAAGAIHHHPHEQFTYILSGAGTYTIAGETRAVRAGEAVHLPSNIEHGFSASEPTKLLDVFSPPREDFR